jgi:hypothetical protein
LKIGTIKDSFQAPGKMPIDKDRLNRSVSGTLPTETNFLSMNGEMPSILGLFCSSSPNMASSTAVCVSWTKDTLCDSCFSYGKVSYAESRPADTESTLSEYCGDQYANLNYSQHLKTN